MTAEPSITGREHWTDKGPVFHSVFNQSAPIYQGA